MMFYLSKIVWGLFQPSSLLIILFAVGAVMAWAGRTRAAMRLFASGAALYVIFGFSPLANWVMAPLEVRAKAAAAQSLDGAAGIIVLGGAIESAASLGGDAPHLNESGDRMVEALRLAARYPSLPVFFSGGKADLFPREDRDTEAALALRFFAAFNLTPPRVRFEDRSRNTFENAVEAAKELQPKPGQKWICHLGVPHAAREGAVRGAGLRDPGAPGGLQDERLRWLVASVPQGFGRSEAARPGGQGVGWPGDGLGLGRIVAAPHFARRAWRFRRFMP